MTHHTRRVLIFPIILSLAGGEIAAQYKSNSNFGVKAGVCLSKISGIGDMLVSESFYSGYSFTDDFRPSVSANIFFSYQVPRTPIGLEARISYMQRALLIPSNASSRAYNITEHRNDSQYIGVSIGWILTKSGFTKRH